MLSSQAQVAKLCRQYLKSIGVKGSCTSKSFAGGTSVDVEYNDQSPAMDKQINTQLSQYKYGSFDGMTDSYNYTNSRDDIPQTQYMHINNRFSDELKQNAWTFLQANFAEAAELTTVYDDQTLNNERIGGMYIDQFMFQFLTGSTNCDELSAEFWASIDAPKPRKAAPATDAPDGIEVTEGTKTGYVEIRFPAKPDTSARTALKKSGFRWSPRNTCWWGKADRLPQAYA